MEDALRDEGELKHQLSLLLGHLRVIICCLFLGIAAAIFYLRISTPIFLVTTTVEVPETLQNVPRIDDVTSTDYRSYESLATIAKNFQRYSLMVRVAKLKDFATFPWEGNELIVSIVRHTRLINISVENPDPNAAKLLANAIVSEYLKEDFERIDGERKKALERLDNELAVSREKLSNSQLAWQQLEFLKATYQSLTEQKLELAKLKESYLTNHPEVKKRVSGITDTYATLKQQLSTAKQFIAIDNEVLGDNASALGNTPQLIEQDYHKLMSLEPELSVQVDENRSSHDSIFRRKTEIQRLSGGYNPPIIVRESARTPEKPVRPRKWVVLGAGTFFGLGLGVFLAWMLVFFDNSLKTVDSVERTLKRRVIAVIFGDSRLPDRRWLGQKENRYLPQLVSAHAGKEKAKEPSEKSLEPLILLSDPSSSVAESFRSLRGGLLLTPPFKEKDQVSVLVTSSQPAEGKTFVASNLALAFSFLEDTRTLLIDADLRRSTVASFFDLENNTSIASLEEALSKDTTTAANVSVVPSGLPNLDLLPSLESPPNPAEILSSQSFKDLLAMLCNQYDKIVIDSPPINTVKDALQIAPLVDIALLVLKANSTSRQSVVRAYRSLEEVGPEEISLVFNQVHKKAGSALNPNFFHYASDDNSYCENYRNS